MKANGRCNSQSIRRSPRLRKGVVLFTSPEEVVYCSFLVVFQFYYMSIDTLYEASVFFRNIMLILCHVSSFSFI